ncbi:MAG: hypothetical protein ACM3SS_19680 [Rhodospirillaceae bacterium]
MREHMEGQTADVGGLFIAPPSTAQPDIRREEGYNAVYFYGTREALIAAGIAKPEWLPTDAIAYVRKDGVPVRRRTVRTLANGRYIWAHTQDREGNEICVQISRTKAEQAAWLPKYEAQEKARLDAERGIDAAERKRLDAQSAARQDAEAARKTPGEWLEPMIWQTEAMLEVSLRQMLTGNVKRITEDSRKRIASLGAQLIQAMRNAQVYTVGAEQPPRPLLRLIHGANHE